MSHFSVPDDYNIHVFLSLLSKPVCLEVLHGLQAVQNLPVFIPDSTLFQCDIQRHRDALQKLLVRIGLPRLKQLQLVPVRLCVQETKQQRIHLLGSSIFSKRQVCSASGYFSVSTSLANSS